MSDKEILEIENELSHHPLFLKEEPKEIEKNKELEALSYLFYDDTPENLASYFNNRGNEFFKKGSDKKYYLKESLKAYNEGLN